MRSSAMLVAFCLMYGCSGTLTERPGDVIHGDSRRIQLDKDLMTVCPEFTDTLKTGTDEEVQSWAKKVLAHSSDCRKRNQAWVTWAEKVLGEKKGTEK